MKTYYEILNVPLSADVEEIKKSYRLLAKKCHPDVCSDKNSEYQFNLITTAYKILSDRLRRLKYNEEILKIRFHASKAMHTEPVSVKKDIQVTYSRSLGMLARRGFFLSSIPKIYRKQMDLKYDAEAVIDFWESRNGGVFDISVPIKLPCPDCQGQDHYCQLCDGKSYLIRAMKVKVVLPKAPKSGEIFEVNLTGLKKGRLAVIRANKLRIKIILSHKKSNYKMLQNSKV